jgi:hypothetical protein
MAEHAKGEFKECFDIKPNGIYLTIILMIIGAEGIAKIKWPEVAKKRESA